MPNTAVIVGIDSYPENALRGCARDASDVAECLALSNFAFDCTTIINASATRTAILTALGQFVYGRAGHSDGILLIYFAGHGASLGGQSYLVSVDGTAYDPGISLAHLGQLMEAASQHFSHVIAVLDCCHAGGAITWVNSRPLATWDIDRELPTVNESRCVLAACRPEEVSYEDVDSAHGIFTMALTDGLLGSAVDHQGEITLFGLHDYVVRAVEGAGQTPVFKGDVAGTVVLGSGFEPRKGPPIPRDELDLNLSKARTLLDEYYYSAQKDLSDRKYRYEFGARSCALRLEPIIQWFRDTEVALPDLSRNATWQDDAARLRGFQTQLSEFSAGLVTKYGQVGRHLGHGGFGHVWQVQASEGQSLAYKVFHGNELDDQIKVQRFYNGYVNTKKLDHPRIVKVHDLTHAPYGFVMDEIPGDNLRQTFVDPANPEVALRLMLDVAETVQHAHAAGVRHRDIKPENIIVVHGEEGLLTPYLTDFDLAYHETNRTVTSLAGIGGVINYAAPEQLFAPNTAAARAETVDVYSLGQLMFYVVVGEDPSGDDLQRNQLKLERRLNEWTEGRAAQELMDLYTRSVARDVAERPPTVEDFAVALARAETYVLAASGNDSVPDSEFCRRLAHQYAGIGKHRSTDEKAEFLSLSGQFQIIVRNKGISAKDYSHLDFEIEMSVTADIPVGDLITGSAGRNAINHRLDNALKRFQRVRRHPGNQGSYQTFIAVAYIPMTLEGLMQMHEILLAAIGALEQWG